MVSINQLLAGTSALSLAGLGLVKTEMGNQIQRDIFGQTYKTAKNSVTNCYNCLTTEGKKSDKYIGALELVTSEIWTGMNSDLRSDFLSRGFPILNVSTINPEKNAEVIKAWTYEAVNCNRVYLQCYNEREECNKNYPSALQDSLDAERKINAEKERSKKELDEKQKEMNPLLVRQGKCEELEELKEEVKRLRKIEIEFTELKAKHNTHTSIFNWN